MAQSQHHGSSEPQNRQQKQNQQNQEARTRFEDTQTAENAGEASKAANKTDNVGTKHTADAGKAGKTKRVKTPLGVAAKAKAVGHAAKTSSHAHEATARAAGKVEAKAKAVKNVAETSLRTHKAPTKVKKTVVHAQKKAANAEKKVVNVERKAKTAEKKVASAEKKALTAEQRAAAAEKKALLRADTFTNAPKVSRDTLTREEREEIAKHVKEERKEAKKLRKTSRSPIGRWWRKVQASPDKVTLAMAIVTLGVVYGDIGTSPLYTVQTFLAGQGGLAKIDRPAVLGMLSLIFWTLLLITTVKYVLVAMHADNKGEGGIFALFSLVRHYGKWLVVPAMIGGAAFLADSVLTPAVSISSAVEGLKTIPAFTHAFEENTSLTLMITIVIIVVLFSVQARGTESIGKVFGSVVLVWFAFLALVGIVNLSGDWSIFEAINPVYGVEFLFSSHNVAGISLMGTVFLSTTGAEALYSDMGHVGRGNIYFTWPFINVALVLNYFGQGAWMLGNRGDKSLAGANATVNPFFQMMSPNVRYVGVILSVAAGVIASQALITGAFTMVSEATGLNWMPHLQVRYPSRTRGQLYIPTVNVVLCIATLTVLAIFKDSEHISAAYGLALTITMLATTILLTTYVWHHHHRVGAVFFFALFVTTDSLFFISSMSKFLRGGWFTMLLTAVILLIMITWNDGTKIERSQRRHMKPRDFKPALAKLHDDFRIPYFADNIVYLTSDSELRRLDTDIFFSIFADHPKRARAWWAVSVVTTDEPFTREYSVENFDTDYIFRVRIRLGFKVSQSIPAYIHQIMHDLSSSGELPEQKSVYPKVDADPDIGTVRYVLVHKALMPESKITGREALSLKMKYAIRHMAGSPVKWFGLAPYNPVVEVQPLFLSTRRPPRLKRVAFHTSTRRKTAASANISNGSSDPSGAASTDKRDPAKTKKD
ncbi:KUP/HAK/KT family potassium transporter [Bifidobacterium sp. ESL0728]|uniref:KUP/HAK/KT family potassium transporter n=1 Tax=Bifidobacterium sp. ESL0728 TaxID=2983220 RepID=UPI0023F8010C|nr:KUP/HAK/KT family potassium transporter [Bifidobacterium sp. ESL0728]WEV59191.1 KUP/HAK/KT family potassium transporter [Bifidobacterium sp. ESL0728]